MEGIRVHTAKLGAYGNTALPASQLRSAVRESLNGQASTLQIDVFFMDTPHSGGSIQSLQVSSVRFDDDNPGILLGKTEDGATIAFFLRDPDNKTATFVIEKME